MMDSPYGESYSGGEPCPVLVGRRERGSQGSPERTLRQGCSFTGPKLPAVSRFARWPFVALQRPPGGKISTPGSICPERALKVFLAMAIGKCSRACTTSNL